MIKKITKFNKFFVGVYNTNYIELLLENKVIKKYNIYLDRDLNILFSLKNCKWIVKALTFLVLNLTKIMNFFIILLFLTFIKIFWTLMDLVFFFFGLNPPQQKIYIFYIKEKRGLRDKRANLSGQMLESIWNNGENEHSVIWFGSKWTNANKWPIVSWTKYTFDNFAARFKFN